MAFKNVGWQRVLGLILPYIFTLSYFQFFGFLIADIDIINGEKPTTTKQHLILSFFNLIGTLLIIWVFTKYVDKINFIDLGFIKKWKQFVLGLLIGSGIIIFGFSILLFLNEINILNYTFNIKEIFKLILLFIIIAFIEEILFRGYILKNLLISFHKYIALLISAILFALIHSANPNMNLFSFFNLTIAGIFLGISYLYTKNLWFPIGLHLSWNLIQSLLGFNVSGQKIYSIINISVEDSNLINGGEFGFEGSILSVIFQIIAIIIIYIYFEKGKKTIQIYSSK